MSDFWTHCLEHFQSTLNPSAGEYLDQAALTRETVAWRDRHRPAPSRFVAQWMKDKYLGEIETAGHGNLFRRAARRHPAPSRRDRARQRVPESRRTRRGGERAGQSQGPSARQEPARILPDEETRLNHAVHLRQLRARQGQRPGARRRPAGRRQSRLGLQPAVRLRRRRSGQDASDSGHRQQGPGK
jgi:hypothetical protein